MIRVRRTATTLAVSLLSLAMVATGCGETDDPVVADPGVELSVALAFRDGDPAIKVVSPVDGAVVTSPLFIEVETENFKLGPAGRTHDGRGHLHILVDGDCYVAGEIIVDDATNPHGDLGQRRIRVDLAPGHHRLCVQVTDGFHVAVAIWQEIELEVVSNIYAEAAGQ